jgi:hypothetical protein
VAKQDHYHARGNTPSLRASVFRIRNTRTAVGALDLQLAHSKRRATELVIRQKLLQYALHIEEVLQ